MEIIIKGVLIDSIDDIEIFQIRLTEEAKKLVKKKLEYEYQKGIKILRELKENGTINSISIPKNKKIQTKLDNLIKAKRIIKQSIRKIIDFYS